MFLTRRPCTSCIRALTYSPRIPCCYRCLSTSSSSSSSTPTPSSVAFSNAPPPAHIPPHLTPAKYPIRGGQNLSSRYRRLKNSLRSKVALEKTKEEAVEVIEVAEEANPALPTGGAGSTTASSLGTSSKAKNVGPQLFHGLKIPEAPKPPESDECCMSGCAICVYDLHDDSLSAHKESVSSVQASLDAMGIAKDTWPESIRPPPPKSKSTSTFGSGPLGGGTAKFGSVPPQQAQRAASLSAFEEMEMRLKAKQAPQASENVDLSSVVDSRRVLSEREIRSIRTAKLSRWAVMRQNTAMMYHGFTWMFFGNR